MKGGRRTSGQGVWRVFRQDIIQLLEGFQGILLVFVLPTVMLAIVGQLSELPPPYEVAVYGTPSGSLSQDVYDELLGVLGDVSSVELETQPDLALDPMGELRATSLDLLINLEGETPREWVMYTAEASRPRLASIRQFAAGLERVLRIIEDWYEEERDPDEPELLAEQTERWGNTLGALGSFTPRQLLAYYPTALDRTTDFAAGTLVLIVCFLPFVLAAPTFIREQEAHTLEVLLAAPGIGGRAVLLGKWLFVVAVCMAELLLLMVVIQSVYGIQIKPGFVGMVVLFLPAVVATAAQGLTFSILARAQSQVGMAAALYFLSITLLTGFLLPLEEASWIIRALSQLFPLTAVLPVFKSWAVGADPSGGYLGAMGLLVTQCVVYGAVTYSAMQYAMRRI